METLFELVFADSQIVTDDFFAKETNQHIDHANRTMYEFYNANKQNLNTFFLVIRKENNSGIRLDRLSEEQLSHRLNDKDFADTVLNVKIWAFYDKNKGDLDVSNIFNATDANLHCIQNLCQKMREITIRKPAPAISRMGSMLSNSSKKSTASGATPAPNTKPANNSNSSQGNTGKQPVLAEITNKSKITTQKSMDEAFTTKNKLASQKSDEMATEKEKSQLKKRKTMNGDDEMAKEVGKDKELKKTKLTREPSITEFTQKSTKTIQEEEVKEPAKPQHHNTVKEHAKPQQNTVKEHAKPQVQSGAIEIEDDGEETYYGGEPAAKRGGLSRLESKASQNSFEEEIETKPVAKPVVQQQQAAKNSSPSFERKPVSSTQMNEETMPGDTEDTIKVKRTRKVPQDKSYMDEKGYLVVEKGWVDEEYWEVVKKSSFGASQNQALTNSQVKKQAQKPVEKSQATLGSFFKKK